MSDSRPVRLLTLLALALASACPTAPDTTPPLVVSVSAEGGATAALLEGPLRVVLSEVVDCATVSSSSLRVLTADGGVAPGSPSCDGALLGFTPDPALAPGSAHRLVLGTTIADPSGNRLPSAFEWPFATLRFQVLGVEPEDGAAGVPADAGVTLRLSEAPECATLAPGAVQVTAGGAPVPGQLGCAGPLVTFSPTEALPASREVLVSAGAALRDRHGNPLSPSFQSRFTTQAGVAEVLPADQASGVPLDAVVAVRFTEALDCASVSWFTFGLYQGLVPVQGAIGCAGDTATFTPEAPLSAATTFTVDLGSQEPLRTASGAAVGGRGTSRFTTTTFGVLTLAPPGGATQVDLAPGAVTATLSGPVDCATATPATVRLTVQGVAVRGSLQCQAGRVSVVPWELLEPGTSYTLALGTGLHSATGQALGAAVSASFTTVSPVRPLDADVPNGPVSAVALGADGGTVYLAGAFDTVGPLTGSLALVDLASGRAQPVRAMVDGPVQAVISDGDGGWFIGGRFSRVGPTLRAGLAHLLADGSADRDWNLPARSPPAPPDVRALALAGATLYVGGDFVELGGVPRAGLAAVGAGSAALLPWDAGVANQRPAPARVDALALSGDTLYVGGTFAELGGQPRANLGALEVATGAVTPWNPGATDPDTYGVNVSTFALSGSTLYVGGAFTTLGGARRLGLGAVDVDAGAPRAFDPTADLGNSGAQLLALAMGPTGLHAGGAFSHLGGADRAGLAELDPVTGAATAWNPAPFVGTMQDPYLVRALRLQGRTLYVGGQFLSLGGQPRSCLAAVSIDTGLATGWDPAVTLGTGATGVAALASSATGLWVGGTFSSLGGLKRRGLAAVDVASGRTTGWDPAPTPVFTLGTPVAALAVSGAVVYAGGDFTAIGGRPRAGLAALSAATGAATGWDPFAHAGPAASGTPVRSLAVAGSTVYLCGGFTSAGGQPRSGLAVVDADGGAALPWSPALRAAACDRVAVDGARVHAAGAFGAVAGLAAGTVVALDATTAAPLAWPVFEGPIQDLAAGGGRAYVAGYGGPLFGSYGDRWMIGLDGATGEELWNAHPAGITPYVQPATALTVTGTTVYVAGQFLAVRGQPRVGLAALDAFSAAVLPWNPGPVGTSPDAPRSLAASATHLAVGGGFGEASWQPRTYLAIYPR